MKKRKPTTGMRKKENKQSRQQKKNKNKTKHWITVFGKSNCCSCCRRIH